MIRPDDPSTPSPLPLVSSSAGGVPGPDPTDPAVRIAELERQVLALQDWGDSVIAYLEATAPSADAADPGSDRIVGVPPKPPR